MAKDRRAELQKSGATLNGIDFVEIASNDQRTLRVHFLNSVSLAGSVTEVSIIGGDSLPEVKVTPIDDATDWSADDEGRPVLTLQCAAAGDFSTYTLILKSNLLDTPYFSEARFSFKALCPSPLDCRQPAPDCPVPDADVPPIDYLAKDFLGFRKALSDFAALRYPGWVERSEADLGVVMMELLSAAGDDLSYTQDRFSTEAYLETATERVSITRHARLVDYEPSPALAAQVWLQFKMTGPGSIQPGLLVSTATPDATQLYFETGAGLADTTVYPASPLWNEIQPYWLDDKDQCLRAGATSMWVEGHGKNFEPGQYLLIETAADPPLRQLVRLAATPAEEITDAVFGVAITRIRWIEEDALEQHRDLAKTKVKGNLARATQGRRFVETFAVGTPPPAAPQTPLTVGRTGPRQAPIYRYTLSQNRLGWLATKNGPRPEIALRETSPSPKPWDWRRWLLDSAAQDAAFTVDPARYARIRTNSDRTPQHDYDGSDGDTLRFGDGQFGNVPETGSVFEVTYRAGAGQAGNVAPDSSWRVEHPAPIESVTNPFPATGGADPETDLSVRRLAPQAFRAVQYRAVLKKDYEDAAATRPWVQRAGTRFRWTGSWISVFTTPDPTDTTRLSTDRRIELLDLLNRYRMAGYESYVPNPRFAPFDFRIRVCARSDSFRGDVHAAVLEALEAFFDPDNFSFGQPLERSALETAIQNAPGVGGVVQVLYRRRGHTVGFVNMPVVSPVGFDEILLAENNPSRPERGSYNIEVLGGK